MAASASPPSDAQSASRWTCAQIGAREHFGIPRGFHQLRKLRSLHTDMWCGSGQSLLRRGPAPLRAFAARRHKEIPSDLVHAHNFSALRRSFFGKKPVRRADEFYAFIETGEWFANAVLKSLRQQDWNASDDRFFAFNTGCLEILPFLREQGVFSVVDQIDPARTEEQLVLEEIERWPGWQPRPDPIPESYFQRLSAEWDQADLVVVNSDWSRRALIEQGVPDRKIAVIPLSISPSESAAAPRARRDTLTVLWLGNVILRKGIQYLVEAAKLLESQKNVRFIVAGPIGISESVVASAPANMDFVGRVTRDRAHEFYQAADLFVLPTVSDGFALTQLEAMAHGLPVIATPNCGEVVTDGIDGFIVPARDSTQLAERIIRLSNDADLLETMRSAALKRVLDFPISRPVALIEAAVNARTQ